MVYGKASQSKTCCRNRLEKKKKKKTTTTTTIFPFHRLPTDVIRGILSQLPFKEAARTSIVSRNWRQQWTCYPKLVLTRETMLGSSNNPTLDEATTALFIRRVNSIVLQLLSSSATTLSRFVLKFPLLGRDADHIDRWVSLSAASRARRIILDLCPEATTGSGRAEIRYSFPLHLFSASSSSCVKSLCLGFVSLKLSSPPSPSLISAAFTNLKKLGLHMVIITGDIQCLLPECDVLEWLSLTRCSLHPYLIIHHRRPLRRLRYLRVLHCRLHRLELQAPNLVQFEFTNYPTPFALGDCRGISLAHVGLLSAPEYSFGYACTELPAALPHVQNRLSIILNIRTEAQVLVRGGISVFARLRHLVLNVAIQGCSKTGAGVLQLACLLDLAPVLEELEIHMCYRETPFYCDLEETSAQCLHKHLRVVYMTGFYAICRQLELARHILRSSPALERMIIDPHVKIPKGRSPLEFPDEAYYPSLGRGLAKSSLKPYEFPGTVITVL